MDLEGVCSAAQEYLGTFYNKSLVENQARKILNGSEGYRPQDLIECIKWWYTVRQGDPSKSNGGIGILNFVLPDYLKYREVRDAAEEARERLNLDDCVNLTARKVRTQTEPPARPKGVYRFFD